LKDKQIQSSHERATGDRFIQTYNNERGCNLIFKEQPSPPKPDLVYYDEKTNKTIGLEITDAYYDEDDAKGTWDIVRGVKPFSISRILYNPDEQLANAIGCRILEKSRKKYKYCDSIILLVVTRPALTEDEKDFRDNVLPHIRLPNHIPFSAIYLDVAFSRHHRHYCLYSTQASKRGASPS